MSKREIADFKRRTAKRLRENATEAETILWRHLRRLEVKGSHFRRQAVVGPYIADFVCLSERLIIEVDGSQHGTESGIASDAARTRWLEAEGYRVLRFWNNEVITEIDSVMQAIYQAIERGAHPTPTASRSTLPLKGRVASGVTPTSTTSVANMDGNDGQTDQG